MNDNEKLEKERNAKLRELKAKMLELELLFDSRGMLYWLDQETHELMYQDVNEPPAKPHLKNPQSRRMEKIWRQRKDYPWPSNFDR
jgi:hypothetical protein